MRKDLITDYSRGEISPLLEGRFDLEFYKQSNSFAENIIPLNPSGFSIRPGTYYYGETVNADPETIIIPKTNDDGTGIIIEMGDDYAKMWFNGVPMEGLAPAAIKIVTTGIAKEELAGMTWIQEGDYIQFASHDFAPTGLYLPYDGVTNEADDFAMVIVPFDAKAWEKYEQVYVGDVRIWTDGHYYICIKDLDGTISESTPDTQPTYWDDNGTTKPASLKPFATGSTDYPAVVSLHEGRRIYSNTPDQPVSIYASRAGNSDIYALGVQADDPWSYDLPSASGSIPHWMVSTDTGITVGTPGGEWQVRGGDLGITPESVFIKRLSSFGSSPVGARLQGSQIYFFGNSGEDLYNYFYQESSNAYQSSQLSLIAEHMLADDYYTDITETTLYGGSGVKEFAFQNDPQKIFWMIKNSGQLIGMNVSNTGVAWHKHTTKKGQFQSIAVIPGTDYDEVWFIVKREIDSVTKYFIEKMGDLDIHQDIDSFHLVDCGIETRGDATPDLTHLNGEEVSVSLMGRYTAFKMVTDDTIDILSEYPSTTVETSSLYFLNAATAHIGLFSEARIRTMRQSFPGTAFSIGKVVVRIYRSYGGAITNGVAPGELQYLLYPPAPENGDLSSPYSVIDILDDDLSTVAYQSLFSGEKELDFIGDWDTNGYIWIVIDRPTPFIVLGMYVDVEDGE